MVLALKRGPHASVPDKLVDMQNRRDDFIVHAIRYGIGVTAQLHSKCTSTARILLNPAFTQTALNAAIVLRILMLALFWKRVEV